MKIAHAILNPFFCILYFCKRVLCFARGQHMFFLAAEQPPGTKAKMYECADCCSLYLFVEMVDKK